MFNESDQKQLTGYPGETHIRDLMRQFGGASFNSGLYRVHSIDSLHYWNAIVYEMFPEHRGTLFCFGYDWHGCQFALDTTRLVDAKAQVTIIDSGAGECLKVPLDIYAFHNVEMVESPDEALSSEHFESWKSKESTVGIKRSECVGFATPIFLGGAAEVTNMELIDLSVYWELNSQLFQQTRNEEDGTNVDEVSIR